MECREEGQKGLHQHNPIDMAGSDEERLFIFEERAQPRVDANLISGNGPFRETDGEVCSFPEIREGCVNTTIPWNGLPAAQVCPSLSRFQGIDGDDRISWVVMTS